MEKAWNVALTPISELKMIVTEKSFDDLDQTRRIRAENGAGKDIQITLAAASKDVTTVKVRVGIFGDKPIQKQSRK